MMEALQGPLTDAKTKNEARIVAQLTGVTGTMPGASGPPHELSA